MDEMERREREREDGDGDGEVVAETRNKRARRLKEQNGVSLDNKQPGWTIEGYFVSAFLGLLLGEWAVFILCY